MVVHGLACRNQGYLRRFRNYKDVMGLGFTMLSVPVFWPLLKKYPALLTLPIEPVDTLFPGADGRRVPEVNQIDLSADRIVAVIYLVLAFLYLIMFWRQWNPSKTEGASGSGDVGEIDKHHDPHDGRRRIVSFLAAIVAFAISILYTLGPPSRISSSFRAIAVDPSGGGGSTAVATTATIGSEGADPATVEALGTQIDWASPRAIGPTAVVSGTVASPNVEQPGRGSSRSGIKLLAPANNATVGPSTAMRWRLTQPLAQGDRIEMVICRGPNCTSGAMLQNVLEGSSVGPTTAGTYSWFVRRTSFAGELVTSHRYWFVVDLTVTATPGVKSSYPTAVVPGTGSQLSHDTPTTRPVGSSTAIPAPTARPPDPTEMPTNEKATSEPTPPPPAPPVPTTSPTEESPPVAPPVPTQ